MKITIGPASASFAELSATICIIYSLGLQWWAGRTCRRYLESLPDEPANPISTDVCHAGLQPDFRVKDQVPAYEKEEVIQQERAARAARFVIKNTLNYLRGCDIIIIIVIHWRNCVLSAEYRQKLINKYSQMKKDKLFTAQIIDKYEAVQTKTALRARNS
jgi:hypothetical protein